MKLVEAAPVAGALRFEILSEGRQGTGGASGRADRERSRAASPVARTQAGRAPGRGASGMSGVASRPMPVPVAAPT